MNKEEIILNAKNIIGWKTNRKIIVFSIDDFGNVRVDSKQARLEMDKQGLKILKHFDALDALESREDLEILFDTLTSVKDFKGKHPIFTAFCLPTNINFDKLKENNYSNYEFETLPNTYQKLGLRFKNYERTWELWKEGINNNFLVPQFHGREHLNIKIFNELLKVKDHELLTALKNHSYTSIQNLSNKTISYTAAFDFFNYEENNSFHGIIKNGLDLFEEVYGNRAVHFNSPGGEENRIIHKYLLESGIKYIDAKLIKMEHLGKGKYRKEFNYTGKKNKLGQIFLVRNCVFEPSDISRNNWLEFAIKQIEIAFRWNRPAIISSHRVNFSGHINEDNRKNGNKVLGELLKLIIKKWPDAEFMSANELGNLIQK
jgi:hypothetical protein